MATKRKLIIAIALLSPGYTLSTEATGQVADISNFDIVGVKLGMTAEHAHAQTMSGLGLSTEDITLHRSKSRLSRRSMVTHMTVWTDDYSFRVIFKETPPTAENEIKLVVAEVVYQLRSRTEESKEKLISAAVKKYGTPSLSGREPSWCATVTKNMCDRDEAYAKVGIVNNLVMSDVANYEKNIAAYLRKVAEEKAKEKSQFDPKI